MPKGSGRKSRSSRNPAESQGDPIIVDGTMVLAPVADMAVACEIVEALRDALEQQAAVVIDAAAVEDLSTPCAQALVAAAASFSAASVPLAFRRPSDAFVAAFNRIGLYAAMMRWSFVE